MRSQLLLYTVQVLPARSSSFARGQALTSSPCALPRREARCVVSAVAAEVERLRLNNLSPQDGARRKNKRKGRGYGAGQVLLRSVFIAHAIMLCITAMLTVAGGLLQGGTCGFGMRGQKARAGSGVRPGFEGGQTPLYRKLPKLKGIAGGAEHHRANVL